MRSYRRLAMLRAERGAGRLWWLAGCRGGIGMMLAFLCAVATGDSSGHGTHRLPNPAPTEALRRSRLSDCRRQLRDSDASRRPGILRSTGSLSRPPQAVHDWYALAPCVKLLARPVGELTLGRARAAVLSNPSGSSLHSHLDPGADSFVSAERSNCELLRCRRRSLGSP